MSILIVMRIYANKKITQQKKTQHTCDFNLLSYAERIHDSNKK